MIPVSTAAQVRFLDARAIRDLGIPGPVLMENAGRLAAAVLRRDFPHARRVLVLCGRGNNGGDGWVLARHLRLAGLAVEVWSQDGAPSPDCALNRRIAERLGVPVLERWAPDGVDVVVDALLGTGLSAELGGPLRDQVDRLNDSGLPVLAVDIPTGLHADRGLPLGAAVQARATVTFGRLKPCFFLGEGADLCGRVVLADIGLDAGAAFPPGPGEDPAAWGATLEIPEPGDVARWLPRRTPGAHKGQAGHLAVVAGSGERAGAAVLAANAAMRAGAGLVTLFVPREAWARLHGLQPEVMVADPADLDPARFDALAVGPGLGTAPPVAEHVRRLWVGAPVPAVFDADGLNALGPNPSPSPHPRLLTPHPGEAARLLGAPSAGVVQADRLGALRRLERLGTVLLKGRHTLVSGPLPRVNPTGGPQLATAGAGDVLTGVAGALLARGLDPATAGAAAAFVHGVAAERAGDEPILAGDVSRDLPSALREVAARRPVVDRV